MRVLATGAVALLLVAAPTHAQKSATTDEAKKQDNKTAAKAGVFQMLSGWGSQLGVSVRDLTDEDATRVKAPALAGALVESVDDDSPAQTAGFKPNDVVVEFDGERVRSTRQFTRLVQETPAGRQVPAAVLRDGQRVALSVTPREGGRSFQSGPFGYAIGPGQASPKIVPPVPPAPPAPPAPGRWHDEDFLPDFRVFMDGTGRLGVTVSSLSTQLAEHFGAKDGVLVSAVHDGSAAAKAGVRAGDVITALDGGAITTPNDLRRRSQRLEDGEEFSLTVVRDKKAQSLKGKVEAPPRRSTARTLRTVL